MQQVLDKIKIRYIGCQSIPEIKKLPAKSAFDEDVISFLDDLARAIRSDKEAKQYSDIVTFGFFCRRANIEQVKQQSIFEGRIGRGFSFHIAPSNVAINFAYSLVAGLLSGNACVVRVSTKEFDQTRILCRLFEEVVKTTDSSIGKYIAVIQYEHDKEITDALSALADVRVIWGGDQTIARIRESRILPRCVEVTFADRYSIGVIRAESVMEYEQNGKVSDLAKAFYNDTYLFDQNACSSPRLIYWIGEPDTVAGAQTIFWNAVHEWLEKNYQIEPVMAVDKLMMDYKAAIELDDAGIITGRDNLIHRIRLKKFPDDLTAYTCPGGSFLEYQGTSLEALETIVTTKFQTLTYLGMDAEELRDWVIKKGLSGIDRIVPFGQSADFRLEWDGYDLIQTMSRKVTIQ